MRTARPDAGLPKTRKTGNDFMLDTNGPLWNWRTFFAAFVLIVFATSVVEVLNEFRAGETLGSMGDDLARLLISALVLGTFLYDRHIQQKTLLELSGQLEKARGQLARLDSRSVELAGQYRAVMQKQFNAWNLTASEQDVVIGMLKGLSFREIAGLRETREKTVRQQASTVYRKAGVSSRNELTAWFFEDMLDPLPVQDG
ncbi:helix-turn-helix transcriptional regulator [Roseibium sp.]|uniref:helix-turn-helix transcriptional regulator n=1 Tax=Roseibium sp. TaxID=1936156 RepID=UPI003BAD5739